MAKEYQQLPSDILKITDPYLAYCIDSSVYAWGSEIDAELENVKGKKPEEIKRKRERVLQKWLGIKQKFRNPMAPTTTREKMDQTLKGEN